MSYPAVLIRKSTGAVLNPNGQWPALDGNGEPAPVPGLDPDLEWLLKHEPYPRPEADSRYYFVQKTEAVTAEPHPDYPFANQYLTTYDTVKRAAEEIKAQARNVEASVLNEVFTPREQSLILALGVGILFRKTDNATLNPKEEAVATLCKQIALRVWNNRDVLQAKLDLIDGDQEVRRAALASARAHQREPGARAAIRDHLTDLALPDSRKSELHDQLVRRPFHEDASLR